MDTRIITNLDLNCGFTCMNAAATVLVKVARRIAKPLYSFWHPRTAPSWLSHSAAILASIGQEAAEAVVRRRRVLVPVTVRLGGTPLGLPQRRS